MMLRFSVFPWSGAGSAVSPSSVGVSPNSLRAIPRRVCVAALGAALVLGGCSKGADTTAPAQTTTTDTAVFAVNTTTAIDGMIQDYLPLSGDIVSGSSVDVYPEVATGKITQRYVAIGDRVTRNQSIAAVDPSRPGLQYKINVVRTPIAGIVIALPGEVGMTVSQATPVARISSSDALEIKLDVSERFIARIALAQPCEITLDAYPDDIFRGSVREISPIVDPASRTMEIKINVENDQSKLKPGMFAKVKVITEQKDHAILIPIAAIVNRGGETIVFTAEGSTARQKTITTGIQIDGEAEVTSGLAVNDEVVVQGMNLLQDGARINVIQRVDPQQAAGNGN